MKALITGASSGLGEEFAKQLSEQGYDLIIVARRKERLDILKKDLSTNVQVVDLDLSDTNNCIQLFEMFKNDNIDLVINNAGFGVFGSFDETDLDKELEMMNTNMKATHILTKLFLKQMITNHSGQILNVASAASFSPGPLMATYYATKSYITRLSLAIHEELRKKKSNVKISILCPGPVTTEFNRVAKVEFAFLPLTKEYVVKYTLKQMKKGKQIIVPGIIMKVNRIFSKLLPDNLIMKIVYHSQKRKRR